MSVNEFSPAIGVPINNVHDPERRLSAALVKPDEQFLKMRIGRHGLRLIDDLEVVLELGDGNRAATAMHIAPPNVHFNKKTRIVVRTERRLDRPPINAEMLEKLQHEQDMPFDSVQDLAEQYGILAQQGEYIVRLMQVLHVTREAFFGGIAFQLAL